MAEIIAVEGAVVLKAALVIDSRGLGTCTDCRSRLMQTLGTNISCRGKLEMCHKQSVQIAFRDMQMVTQILQ